jgi:hypothetical protein
MADIEIKKEQGMVRWDDELAKYAKEASEAEKMLGGTFLSINDGQVTLAGQKVAGNKLNVIVVGSVHENTWYPGAFDKGNIQPPSCYAFGVDEATMAPHPEAASPQSEKCATCAMNQWGSSEKGKGKACQNRRRLALLPGGDVSPAAITQAGVIYYKVPVTSTRNWGAYVKGLAASVKRPPFGVITAIAPAPEKKVQFQFVDSLPEESIGAVLGRVEEQLEGILFPYAKPQDKKAVEPTKASKKF